MQKTKLFTSMLLFSIFLISCGKDNKEVSPEDFVNNILPKVEVNNVEIENMEKILVHTAGSEIYSVNGNSMDRMETEAFVNRIGMNNGNISVSYTSTPSRTAYIFDILSLLPLISLLLILFHIVLLWIALKKIIKSEIDNTEKLVYTVISIFFLFFGPIIYLTTGRKG